MDIANDVSIKVVHRAAKRKGMFTDMDRVAKRARLHTDTCKVVRELFPMQSCAIDVNGMNTGCIE